MIEALRWDLARRQGGCRLLLSYNRLRDKLSTYLADRLFDSGKTPLHHAIIHHDMGHTKAFLLDCSSRRTTLSSINRLPASMQVVTIDDRDPRIVYSPSWEQKGSKLELDGTTMLSEVAGATAIFQFSGTFPPLKHVYILMTSYRCLRHKCVGNNRGFRTSSAVIVHHR